MGEMTSRVLTLDESDSWYDCEDYFLCDNYVKKLFEVTAEKIQLSLHNTKREAGVNSIRISLMKSNKDYGDYISIDSKKVKADDRFWYWLESKMKGRAFMYLCVWEVLE